MPTALIVEDEPQANKLLSMLVQLHGYATESAYTGSEALEKVRERVPDVVFLDLMLPDRDGYEICRALKSSGTTSLVPVVIVTARIAAENRIESFHAGADDYVPKPYTPDQIFEALDQSNDCRKARTPARLQGDVVLDGRDDGETLRRLAAKRERENHNEQPRPGRWRHSRRRAQDRKEHGQRCQPAHGFAERHCVRSGRRGFRRKRISSRFER